ncbi:DUF2568 domain-containing protein [Streptomyces sp. NPDC059697]|uniref:DUF2568 domain-containing protein n=1 Tax=Streptomyces sp. NPDC059697 TaxID=3346912 RepID=UPI0036BA3B77
MGVDQAGPTRGAAAGRGAGGGRIAVRWGQFAAPTADHPLHGAARAVFEICWFGAGALTAFRAYTARSR